VLPAGLRFDRALAALALRSPLLQEIAMDDEVLNLSIRKFLKMVGVSSQREIEHAVAKALQEGLLGGSEAFPAKMTLEIPGLKLRAEFAGEVKLAQ
jgi:hypothetical protein